jgi:thiol-disulfide isomerase/thioredoxin
MKTLILILLVLVAGFYLLPTEIMPAQDLREYTDRSYGRKTKTIGGECAVDSCVLIYVAPWCPHCQKASPMIISLAQQLKSEGIGVEIVIGRDSNSAIEAYAKKFPFPVYADASGLYYEKAGISGVPSFVVTNRKGKVLKREFGYYSTVKAQRDALDV